MNTQPVLQVRDLSILFSMYTKGLEKRLLKVVNSLDLNVYAGEILAVVGSSGSGKSLLAHSILGILPKNASLTGSITYCGEELSPEKQAQYRGTEIVLIPQSVDFLDPLMCIDKQVIGVRGSKAAQENAFTRYGLKQEVGKMYPHHLSGGMARRVLIATAVMGNPKLIVADEPTPGLDLNSANETLTHFRELADSGTAILLITHDISLAINVADRITFFYAGTTIETASAKDFKAGKDALRHPYSKEFIDALPENSFKARAGTQPYPNSQYEGCLFAERCPIRTTDCSGEIPMRSLRGGEVRCINAS